MHKEIREDDSVLPMRVRRKKGKLKHWKVGWIEEIYDKLSERKQKKQRAKKSYQLKLLTIF